MRDLRAARVLLLAFGLVACHEDGRDNESISISTNGPDFTVCTACPASGTCPEGQVCASVTPEAEASACSRVPTTSPSLASMRES